MNKNGKLIVFEGLDGSGKTTIAREFEVALWQRGITNTYLTHEPFEKAAAGEWIREVLAGEVSTSPYVLALAFTLNRHDHLARFIGEHLALGEIVICDRYVMSSLVYQQVDGLTKQAVLDLNAGMRVPDVTFFLHANEATCLERIRQRRSIDQRFEDRLHDLSILYLQEAYAARQMVQTVYMINADAPQDEVLAEVIRCWEEHQR